MQESNSKETRFCTDGLYIALEKLMCDFLYKFKSVHNLGKMYPHGSWRELKLRDCGKTCIIWWQRLLPQIFLYAFTKVFTSFCHLPYVTSICNKHANTRSETSRFPECGMSTTIIIQDEFRGYTNQHFVF